MDQAKASDFMPLSFVLPREYAMFVEEFKRSGGVWIVEAYWRTGRGGSIFSFLDYPRSRSGGPILTDT